MHKIPTPPCRAPLQGGESDANPLLGGAVCCGGSSTLQNPKCLYPEFLGET